MPGEEHNRSVVDYETEDSLRKALLTDDTNTGSLPDFDPCSSNMDWVIPNLDPSTCEVQSMKEELHRLEVLKSYLILDNEREEAFERITALGSRIFAAPICLISLVDLGRQWFLSNRGLGAVRETPRRHALCAHAIQRKDREPLVVPVATDDSRFCNNPLITGPPHLRFYAGAPLLSPEGYTLGTLCVIDTKPRPEGITQDQCDSLKDLAAMAVKTMVDRRNMLDSREDPSRLIAYTAHDLMTPLTGVQLSLSLLAEDEDVTKKLQPHQTELLTTASTCSDLMIRICETAIGSLRQHNRPPQTLEQQQQQQQSKQQQNKTPDVAAARITRVKELVKSLQMIMDPIPKKVPLILSLDPTVPRKIFADDLKLFRSALNLVSNATDRTTHGKVHLRIYARRTNTSTTTNTSSSSTSSNTCSSTVQQHHANQDELVFECEDTGKDIPVEEYQYLFQPSATDESRLRLGLSSLASLVSSQNGQYGFRPRSLSPDGTGLRDSKGNLRQGSLFWFSVPFTVVEEEMETELTASLEGKMSASTLTNSKRRRSANMPIVPLCLLRSGGAARASSTSSSSSTTTSSRNAVCMSPRRRLVQAAVSPSLNTNAAVFDPPPIVPQVEIPSEDRKLSPIMSQHVATGPRQKRALVIEDSLVVRKSLARALSKLGFDVEQAVNGLEGLRFLKEITFDIVLCDFLMPVMDGLDCVKQYRAWEKEHRPQFHQIIIGISAHVSCEESGQGIEAGMDDFRPKPISIKTLTELSVTDAVVSQTALLDQLEGPACCSVDDADAAAEGHVQAMQAAATVLENDNKMAVEGVENRMSESATKRTRREQGSSTRSPNNDTQIPVALIAMDTPTLKSNEFMKVLESNGWKVVVVHDGKDALRLMQMRNWDVVLVDDDIPNLPAIQCIAEFREWEANSRVNEQKNVFIVCDCDIPSLRDTSSVVQPPFGFNGVLQKPVVLDELAFLLKERSTNLNILVRK